MISNTKRNRILFATATAALSTTMMSGAAWADCVNSGPSQVTCDSPGGIGTNGYYNPPSNGIYVTVVGTGIVDTKPTGALAPITVGTGSTVNNFGGDFAGTGSYGISATQSHPNGSTDNTGTLAIIAGSGSTITNTSNAQITGDIKFGSSTDLASGTNVNTFNNNYSSTSSPANINGNITSYGNTVINNQGTINYLGGSTITQSGAGTVIINNGVAGGYASTALGFLNNSVIWSSISTVGDTTINNLAGGVTSGNNGAIIYGNVTVGTGYAGTSTINNSGTITGNVTMDDATNVFNAGTSGSSTLFTTTLPGSGTGTLTGISGGDNTLNLYGTNTGNQLNASVVNFYTINKYDTGTWTLGAQLSSDQAQTINVNSGNFNVASNAAYLNTAGGTTVYLADGTQLGFIGATGTYSGNIANEDNNTTGSVYIDPTSNVTFTGSNSYTGGTTINGGTLTAGSTGALPVQVYNIVGSGDVTIENGGTLNVNVSGAAMGNLYDAGTGPNTLNISGSNLLSVAGGDFGSHNGVITGSGTLEMNGTYTNGGGTLTLSGNNAGFTGALAINNGTVNIDSATALNASNQVYLDSTTTTTGKLNINANTTIGALNSLPRATNSVVTIGSGDTLTTGGLGGVNPAGTDVFYGQITGAGALNKAGNGSMYLYGADSYTGGTTITAGNLYGFAGANASLVGNFNIPAGNGQLFFDQTMPTTGSQSGNYGGQITGVAGRNVWFLGDSSTVLTLSGDNSGFAGNMNFGNGSKFGTVAISATNNVGTGALNFYGGTLETTATLALANNIGLVGSGTFQVDTGTTTLNGNISNTGALIKTGSGTLVLGGTNTYFGGTTVSAGTLQGVAGVGIQGNVVNNAAVKLTGSYNIYGGNMSGTGTVEISGIVGLAGTNTYSGATTIDSGSELGALSANGLSPNSAIIDNGALGDSIGGFVGNQTIGSLAGTGTVDTAGNTLTTGGDNTSTTFSGTFVSGSGGLTKVGTGTFTLSGTGNTLSGLFDANGGTTSLTGSLSSATAQVDDEATLFVDGTLTTTGGTTVNSGGLLKGGVGTTAGTINGDVINNGTVQPGHSPGIINQATGNYTQGSSGTFLVNVNATSSTPVAGTDFGQYNVQAGTATLDGTLSVIQNGGLYKNGTQYDIITTSGGISGDFATFTNLTISPFISFTPSIIGNDYVLTVTRANYNTVATNPNQVAVANGLQGLVTDPTASSTVIALDNMTAAQAQSLFNQASPEVYGSYATALQDQGELFTRQVAGHLGDEQLGKKAGLWINAYGAWGTGKADAYRYGSDQNTTGFVVGVDTKMANVTVGLAGGYSEDKLNYKLGNSSGKDKSWQVGAYAAYNAGKLGADVQVAYISGDISNTKTINAGTISSTALASTKGNLFKAVGTVGYDLSGGNVKFRPFVGIDFASGHIDSFTETGAGALDLTVGQIKADKTDLMAGFKLSSKMGMLTPYINATYRYRLDSAVNPVSAVFNGNPATAFTVSAIAPSKSQGDVDAGVSLNVGKAAVVFVGYEGTFRSDVTSHGVNGGLRVSF